MRNRAVHSKSRNSEWVCYFCGKVTRQRSNLYTHLRSHLKESPWKCQKCSEYFLFPNRLKEHQAMKHPTLEQIKNSLKCAQCNDKKVFLLKKQLGNHIRSVHSERRHKCQYCHMAFPSRAKLEEHCRTHTKEMQHSCYFCGSKFLSRVGHFLHMLSQHLKENPLKCDKCSYRTYELLVLNSHKRKVHPETDKNVGMKECRLCKLWFRSNYLHYHVQSVHGGLRINQYICYFCGYRCKTRHRYEAHLSKHTRERPLKCETCPFRAYRKGQITLHRRNFHEKVVRYVCSECPRGFVFAKDLGSHLQKVHNVVHKRRTMAIVTRKCATVEKLRRLQNLDEVKTCYFCQQTFSCKKDDFQRHMHRHTLEKPYICKICRYSARTSTMLAKHNRITHN